MTHNADIADIAAGAELSAAHRKPARSSSALTLGQKRLRLLAILEAEQAKRTIFEQRLQEDAASDTSGSSCTPIYEQLISQQNRVITRLERRIVDLTDQLEGPELRQRLKQVEAKLVQAAQLIKQLKQQLEASESARSRAEVDAKLLNTQLQNLQELNDNYVNQIAILSLHERQNEEDHAHTVLAISRQFAKYGLNIPAKACVASLDYEALESGTGFGLGAIGAENDTDGNDERFVADARFDQTIFSARSRQQNQIKILSLVINSIAPELDVEPIELKLTEFDPRTQQPMTKTLKGFATASAIAAADAFVAIYRQLTQDPAKAPD